MGRDFLGVGFAGFGFIGKVHAFSHRSLPLFFDPAPAKTKLVGVCTSRAETAQKAVETAGFDFGTTDPDDLLSHPDIDIVHVCSPNDDHAAFVLRAIAAGKHVYCDKPLTATLADAEVVTAAASASPIVHRMTFNYRFVPAMIRAKQLVDDGFLGEIFHFRAAYLHAGYIDPKRPRTWRLQMSRSGGGAIMDLGVHVFDCLRYLLGEIEPTHAILETRIFERPHPVSGEPAPVDVDDISILNVRVKASGANGILEASRLATGVQDELRFEIHGSRGMIAFNLMDPNFLTIYDATVPEGAFGGNRGPQRIECVTRFPKPYALGATKNAFGWPQTHIHCLHDFVRAVAENDRASGPNFHDSLAAQRFVHQCQTLATK